MPRWLPRPLGRIRELAPNRRVSFTLKALRELAELGSGFDPDDACAVLAKMLLYVKVAVRANCIRVSFHEEEGLEDDEGT